MVPVDHFFYSTAFFITLYFLFFYSTFSITLYFILFNKKYCYKLINTYFHFIFMNHDLLDNRIYEMIVLRAIKFKCKIYLENKLERHLEFDCGKLCIIITVHFEYTFTNFKLREIKSVHRMLQ